ncbi:uncharacterized protein B0J16DRAFT_375017 [Fusarium flagelliforme]|uniref:C2h2 type zinc finger containing protein n=1 Tax=Fusarium flagelliforme TaxID=2675880 RepID=A0A395MF44_9HYPO|nr:uncharacterized protein B0J16DRAFT_375017 [Fusarium flagelliforme]KAH7180092.1 hypothetical protein B0J16DRAFT_375017 [Fusarium flagelliforme]RFN46461.1 c2h2 type zinc finger containing protein [Fusarium flagelliforme]
MASRWFSLMFFLALRVAGANDNEDNPYYTDAIEGCIAENLGTCQRQHEDWVWPCYCGQLQSEWSFLPSFAKCVGRDSPKDINSTYAGLSYDCSDASLTLNITRAEFERISMEGRNTGATEVETASTLSTGTIAGIAVGAIVGGGAMIGALAWFLLKRRKKNGDQLESNPPSSPQQQTSPSWGIEFKPEWTANAPVELPSSHHVPMYEMNATPMRPIEMPATLPEERKKKLMKNESRGEIV